MTCDVIGPADRARNIHEIRFRVGTAGLNLDVKGRQIDVKCRQIKVGTDRSMSKVRWYYSDWAVVLAITLVLPLINITWEVKDGLFLSFLINTGPIRRTTYDFSAESH